MELLPPFRLLRPSSVAEATAALAADAEALPLGGGTDLIPNLRRGLGRPSALVDLTAVAGLAAIVAEKDGSLRIGAGTTLEALASNAAVLGGWPVITEAALTVAGPSHRAAATLGGNLCQDTRCVFYNQSEWWRSANGYCLKHDGSRCWVVVKSDRCYATYHGDVAPALMALGAEAEVAGPAGTRRLKLAELFRVSGADHLTLGQGEFLTAVVVPPMGGWRAGYAKVRVRDSIDFPLAGVAASLWRDGDRVAGLRVAITGSNSAPLLVAVDTLVGKPWDDDASQALSQLVSKASNMLKTTFTSPKYRRWVLQASAQHMVGELWTAAG